MIKLFFLPDPTTTTSAIWFWFSGSGWWRCKFSVVGKKKERENIIYHSKLFKKHCRLGIPLSNIVSNFFTLSTIEKKLKNLATSCFTTPHFISKLQACLGANPITCKPLNVVTICCQNVVQH
jgi:hypothetical protein